MNNREERLFDEPIAFTDFGQSLYSAVPLQQQQLPLTSEPAEVRKAIREQCPAMPGVYGMLDCQQALIYVGMSVQLRDRTQTYFSTGEEKRKERRIGSRARTLLWQPTGHELTARLRELELIRRFSPRYNVLGKPERTPTGYVTLATGRRSALPRPETSRPPLPACLGTDPRQPPRPRRRRRTQLRLPPAGLRQRRPHQLS